MFVSLLFITIVFSAIWYLIQVNNHGKSKPLPGPKGWRSFTAFMNAAKNFNLHLIGSDWAEEYGDIFQIRAMFQKLVFINNMKLIRNLFNNPNFKDLSNDRPELFVKNYVLFQDSGIAFSSRSGVQQSRRKVFHSMLKFYGENLGNLEKVILKFVNDISQQMKGNKCISLSEELSRLTLLIIDFLIAGEETPEHFNTIEIMHNFDKSFGELYLPELDTVLRNFPFLRFLPGTIFKRKYDNAMASRDELVRIYFDRIKAKFSKGYDKGIIAHLLNKQKECERDGNDEFMKDDVIKALLSETTVASYLTSYNAINTLFLLLIRHPEQQERIYTEIQNTIGDSPVGVRHRNQMPYTEAAVLETLRYATSGPFLIPHYAREDIQFEGYNISKGSIILANIWYCHRKPDVWDDPWAFKPERFLDSDGNLFPADHPVRTNMTLFGTGPRGCPGESFARSRLFMVVVTLLQNFQFLPLEGEPLPSADPRQWPCMAALGPEAYRCELRDRTSKCT